MKIYCDSSTKEACLVIEGQDPEIVPYPEPVTVNVGEYKAVILALEEARNRQLEEVEVLTDSLLIVNQVSGLWKCKKIHLLPFRNRVRNILFAYPLYISFTNRKYSLKWIPREENLAGKVLE